MLKKLSLIVSGLMFLVLLSPMFLYWWRLSNLKEPPQPSKVKLTLEQELEIWKKEKEVGDPTLKKQTAYSYIFSIYCSVEKGLYAHECMEKYSGLRMSALAVRNQVADQVHGKGNTVWHITWAAYSIWATRHWDIHQILATYHEAYNT